LHSSDWIFDASGRSIIYSAEFIESSAYVWIHTKVEGIGLKEIGPFHVQIGNEIVKSSTMKIYILPKLKGARNLIVIFDSSLREDVKMAYQTFLTKNKDSKYYAIVKGYYRILEKNSFIVTDEAMEYLKDNKVKSMLAVQPPTY